MTQQALAELNRLEDTDPSPMRQPKRTLKESFRYHREQGHSWFIYRGQFYRMVNGHWRIEVTP